MEIIREKQEGIVSGIAIFLILEFLTYFIYVNALAAQKGEIFEGLFRTTKVVRTLINPVLHQKLQSPEDEYSILYTHQLGPLERALNADSTIEFIYTLTRIDSTIHFVLDATEPGHFDQNGVETKSHVMDVYENPNEELITCFDEERITITREVYYDQWGGHISCFAPFFVDSTMVGAVGIDISTETYNERLQPIKDATNRAMITIFFISYLWGMIMWFLRRTNKFLIQLLP